MCPAELWHTKDCLAFSKIHTFSAEQPNGADNLPDPQPDGVVKQGSFVFLSESYSFGFIKINKVTR